jgi:hypothetical protein
MPDQHIAVNFGKQVALVPLQSIEHPCGDSSGRFIEVSRVIPCAECGAPVCVLEFQSGIYVCDAARGDLRKKSWYADLSSVHVCRVNYLWDTDLLRRLLERTRAHCCGCSPSLYVDVDFVIPCGQCGEMIAPFRWDGGPIEFYRTITLTVPPEMWKDHHTTPDTYIANLGHPHRCPRSSRKEVKQ